MLGLTRRHVLAAALCAGLGAPWAAHARPPELGDTLPGARLLGEGRLTYFGLRVYGARLWVGEGFKPDDYTRHPLALELEYARALVGKLIAERSLDEMKKVGRVPEQKTASWLAAMERTFPDVKEGDRITGLYRPDEGMRFFVNGQPGGDIRDTEFARLFIGIWLSPRSSEPGLRRALLGPPR
ncbi:MAG: chalcone isomerase family protein [Rhizobacter sp.]|nr:chalcone isomerase family protein [Rhizobacter sp.]